MIAAGTTARPNAAVGPARRSGPVNVAAEIDRHLEGLIQNITRQLTAGPDQADRPPMSEAEARMDAIVLLSVTIQSQAEEGDEGDEFMLWLLEEKQKREMS